LTTYTGLDPEVGPHVAIIWTKEDDITSPGYGFPEWECEIFISEELNQKLIQTYRSNRIANLSIIVSASRPNKETADFNTPDSEYHLRRNGPEMIPISYYNGDPLYFRPDSGDCTAMAFAFWKVIRYTEEFIVAKKVSPEEEEITPKKDWSLTAQKTFPQNTLAGKLSELNSTISGVQNYIRLGVICLFAIVIMLMFK